MMMMMMMLVMLLAKSDDDDQIHLFILPGINGGESIPHRTWGKGWKRLHMCG